MIQPYAVYKRQFRFKTTHRPSLGWTKRIEKVYHGNSKQKRARGVILMLNKIDKDKSCYYGQNRTFLMIKEFNPLRRNNN